MSSKESDTPPVLDRSFVCDHCGAEITPVEDVRTKENPVGGRCTCGGYFMVKPEFWPFSKQEDE